MSYRAAGEPGYEPGVHYVVQFWTGHPVRCLGVDRIGSWETKTGTQFSFLTLLHTTAQEGFL